MALAPVQWSIDQLWNQLGKLQSLAKSLKADLDADKAQLTRLWHDTTLDKDAKRRAENQALLKPLIHNNSVLRISYLAPVTAKFQSAVAMAGSALKGAGYTVPTLGGIGIVVAIAPLAAVTIVVAALAIATTAIVLTQAQRDHTASVARLIASNATPEEKKALLDAMAAEEKAAGPGLKPPGPFDVGALIPLAGIVALIVLGPELLRTFRPRRASA